MLFEELQVELSDATDVPFLDTDRTRTPGWIISLACAAHAASTSLAECRDLIAWFGVSRTRATIHYWYQAFAESYDQEFIVTPDRIAVDEKQIQLAEGETVWLYAAIDVDSKVVLHARLSARRGTKPATQFLRDFRRFPTINGFAFDFSRVTKKPLFSLINAKRRKL